jgi:hypothetical protein
MCNTSHIVHCHLVYICAYSGIALCEISVNMETANGALNTPRIPIQGILIE